MGATIKLVNRSTFIKDFATLGLELEDRVRLVEEVRSGLGLILVTSPAFNGANTTAYAIMSFLAQGQRDVLSIESPIQWTVEGVRQVADNRYEIDRNVIDSTLSNLNTIATQARIVPSFKNGVASGFKLFSIQPGSLYSSIGIENGDVIQRVNGYEINSPEKALELYQKLRESAHVTIELERGGQTIRKEYNISGP